MMIITSLFNMGTVRRKEDPILKTQTDPISYKQKMEEMKDGVPKGAPMPSFNLFPKEKFMADPAVGKAKEEPPQNASSKVNVSEVSIPQEEESEEWWNDEKKDDSEPGP